MIGSCRGAGSHRNQSDAGRPKVRLWAHPLGVAWGCGPRTTQEASLSLESRGSRAQGGAEALGLSAPSPDARPQVPFLDRSQPCPLGSEPGGVGFCHQHPGDKIVQVSEDHVGMMGRGRGAKRTLSVALSDCHMKATAGLTRGATCFWGAREPGLGTSVVMKAGLLWWCRGTRAAVSLHCCHCLLNAVTALLTVPNCMAARASLSSLSPTCHCHKPQGCPCHALSP